MDSTSGVPSGLRPPAGGDVVNVVWRADVGASARVGEVADVLRDLDTTIVVGERWGLALARAAAQYQLMYEVGQRGPEALIEPARQFGFGERDVVDVERWYFEGPWRLWRPGRRPFLGPEELVRSLADARTPDLLGTRVEAQHVEYRNPLEVVLTGSGFLIFGTIYALRMVRDWSNKQREGAAEARVAEAGARRQAAGADLMEWLVEEAKAGRLHVPAGELLNGVTAAEGEAMRRLAMEDVQLQLPPGTDTRRSESD